MKRVGIIALLHESNTFLDEPTTLDHFRSNLLAEGVGALEAFRGTQHEVGGFLRILDEQPDVEIVGILGARAMPYGTITAECWQELMQRLETALKAALPLDGLLVAPHGATVAENAPDADGDWLTRVRSIVGTAMPIIGTLDLHANVSPRMVQQCQALFGYRTNPHLDQRARGEEAAVTLLRTLNGEIFPSMSLVQLPLCVNIERQATSEEQGVRLWNEAERLQNQQGMLSISCLYGFPYSDVEEMGATVIAVSERSAEFAREAAVAMASFWWNHRSEFSGQLISVEDAIQHAMEVRERNPNRPVGLLEMGDNVGGGSPGDGTWITHGWLKYAPGQGPLLTVIADAAAVAAAEKAGPGHDVTLSVGGRIDPQRHGPPIEDAFRVISLSDGKFSEPETRHGGYSKFDQGRTAVLQGSSGVTIIATTRRVAPMSLHQVLSQGLNPSDFAAIVIKGVHAPVAAYAPVCSCLIRVNTPGATTADLSLLTFHHRRHPMQPFEDLTTWHP
jgi:microcystin degradation protein MlrC